MSNVNMVVITGVVAREPAIAQTKNGKMMMRFSIKCEREYMYNNEKTSSSTYVVVVAFGNLVDQNQHLQSGAHLMIQGRLGSSAKMDGDRKVYETIVEANEIVKLDGLSPVAVAQTQQTRQNSYRSSRPMSPANPYAPHPLPDEPPRQAQAYTQDAASAADDIGAQDVPF